jgi:hypothetical protein
LYQGVADEQMKIDVVALIVSERGR